MLSLRGMVEGVWHSRSGLHAQIDQQESALAVGRLNKIIVESDILIAVFLMTANLYIIYP